MKTIKLAMYFLMAATFSLVSCNDEEKDLPPIGGFNNSDEVGAADLVAHFPLDGNGKEAKSSTNPDASVNVTYVEAVKGKGAKLAEGYLSYPVINSLNATMESMTISLWAKVSNNASNPTMFFNLTRENEWAGNINFMAETGWQPATSDSLTVKGLAVINGSNWQDTRNTIKVSNQQAAEGNVAFPNKNGGKWAHYVLTWDAPTGTFKVYANGEKISNPKWEVRGGGAALPLGFTTPTKVLIGTFKTVLPGGTPDAWQKSMTGEIDEVRVWKTALPQSAIGALYQLELAGR